MLRSGGRQGQEVAVLGRKLGRSCGLWRKARGEVSLVWEEARWAGERSRRWEPFYVPGCGVPLLVCVCDASFELFPI